MQPKLETLIKILRDFESQAKDKLNNPPVKGSKSEVWVEGYCDGIDDALDSFIKFLETLEESGDDKLNDSND